MVKVKKTKKVAAKKQPRCEAKTAAGTRCKKPSAGNAKYCNSHKTAASRKASEKKAAAAKKPTKKATTKKAAKKTAKKKK